MRRHPSIAHRRHRRGASRPLLIALAFFLCGTLLFGCAAFQKKPPQKKLPPSAHKVQPKPTSGHAPEQATPERQIPKETMRPAAPSTAATPARAASDRLVEKGKGFLAQQDDERAASAFREAVNVDTTNGAAYYYLALAQAHLGQTDVAAGLLEKADALLAGDAEWAPRLENLHTELKTPPSRSLVPSSIDKSF